jgi:hypothetical protein
MNESAYSDEVAIIGGSHKGRTGTVVSVPWLGNLWNLFPVVNVPSLPSEIAMVHGSRSVERIMRIGCRRCIRTAAWNLHLTCRG